MGVSHTEYTAQVQRAETQNCAFTVTQLTIYVFTTQWCGLIKATVVYDTISVAVNKDTKMISQL